MRNAFRLMAAVAGLATSLSCAQAASAAGRTTIDPYAFAGGQEAAVMVPLQTGRSVAGERIAPQAFTTDDLAHAFAPRGYAD